MSSDISHFGNWIAPRPAPILPGRPPRKPPADLLARRRAGHTLEQLAAFYRVSIATINRWVRRAYPPEEYTRIRVQEASRTLKRFNSDVGAAVTRIQSEDCDIWIVSSPEARKAFRDCHAARAEVRR
jgi:hypothetical protein